MPISAWRVRRKAYSGSRTRWCRRPPTINTVCSGRSTHRRESLPTAEVVGREPSKGRGRRRGAPGRQGGEVLVGKLLAEARETRTPPSKSAAVEPGAAEPGTGRTDPAQLPGAGEQLGRHRAVGGVGIGDVVEGVLRIAVRVNDDARHCAPDFLGPRGVGSSWVPAGDPDAQVAAAPYTACGARPAAARRRFASA